MKLNKNEAVVLKLPEFEVDKPLSPHLDNIPLLSYLNKSFACAFVGRAGSGKTSLMTGLLQTKNKFKKVFHKIYLFMPEYSRGSMKKCIFDCLPQDQIYNELTYENLVDVYNKCEENNKNKLLSLVIFDDVQDSFKGECEKRLLKLINNRRHIRTSIILLAQSYIKISRDVRKVLTNHFLFNLSKEEYDDIHSERFYFPKALWLDILKLYRQMGNKGDFMFLDPEKNKIFINWDEVCLDDDETII